MKIPLYLKPKDKIGIVCTARAVDAQELEPAIKLLNDWDLTPVLGNTIGLKHHQFGGTDEERANDLQKAVNDPQIKAIWIARGGYGTARIIDSVDFQALLNNPKWIIGYSDVTALHIHLQHLGLSTLHAQMPLGIDKASTKTIESLRQSLFKKPYELKFTSNFPSISGECEGELIGGNLSVLFSVLQTIPLSTFKEKILILEDLDEYLYHIDRMMLNLYRSGLLHLISGLVVGGMSDMNDNSTPFGLNANEIIDSYTKKLKIPVAFEAPFGHIFNNLAITLGRQATLKVFDNQISLTYN